jgi:SAM-dependent methyltransferase
MPSDFAGSTATHYRRYRRDVADAVLATLCDALMLSRADRVLDLGCGTGQVAVPLAARVGAVIAVDPEVDMLAQFYARTKDEGVDNVTTVLGADRDLATLLSALGPQPIAALTVANALHWMDAEQIFRTSRGALRSGGGVAVITQGLPIWLHDSAWARDLRTYLEQWTGPLTSTCDTDRAALEERRDLMVRVGFRTVDIFEHTDHVTLDVDYVIGHLYSAMSQQQIAAADRPRFERGLREALEPHVVAATLVEHVESTLLLGRD